MPEILKPTEPNLEPIPTGQEPVAAPVAAEPTPSTPAEDLLSRVSKFQKDKDPAVVPQPNNTGDENFDIKEIEAITDPIAKEQAMKAYKSFQRGYGEKFQELSQLKKEMEAVKSQPIQVQAAPQEWTPERVQELARNPQFVEAAKKVAGEDIPDDESTMSEIEKAKITELNQKIANLEQANTKVLTQQQQALRDSQHEALGSKYGNYVKAEIDTITYDMIEGKIVTTPEHIYKAFKHDENVDKAYEMGRQDERNGVSEKIQSTSVEGIQTAAPSAPVVAPEEGESSKKYFARIIEKNVAAAARR